MKRLGLHIIFLCFFSFAFSQHLSISIDKEEIKIGAPFKLTFTVTSDEKWDSISYSPHVKEFLALTGSEHNSEKLNDEYSLELLSKFYDTSYQKGEKFIWKGLYQLTGWDSAYVVIPEEPIFITDSTYYFPAGLIHITSPTTIPGKPIYGINETFTEVKPSSLDGFITFLTKNWWWILLIVILLIATLVYHKKWKNRPQKQLSLRQQTLNAIDTLEQGKGYEVNLKEYYVELSFILRKFLQLHYTAPLLDKTTPEIEIYLRQQKVSQDMIKLIRKLLTQSDMVKFAKSEPTIDAILGITDEARAVVNKIAALDMNNE